MRRLLVALVITLTSLTSSFSQIEKGTVMVGGNAGFQFKTSQMQGSGLKTTEFIFSASPNALYSVIKQFAIGGQVSYAYSLKKLSDTSGVFSEANNTFTIGPAFRGNFFIGKKAYVFIHGSPSFGISVLRDPTDRDKPYGSTSTIAWRLGPGFSVFASKNIAVEFGFYYDGMKQIVAIKQDKNVLSKGKPTFTHGLTVAIGLQFYAHKKPKQLQPVN